MPEEAFLSKINAFTPFGTDEKVSLLQAIWGPRGLGVLPGVILGVREGHFSEFWSFLSFFGHFLLKYTIMSN